MGNWLSLAQDKREFLVRLRREFHRHPELALQEYHTAEVIEQELEHLGIAHKRIGETGVFGVLKGEKAGSGVIALRADIDALPIQEANDIVYRSQTDGVMHACGHDAHTACLLGAAKLLAARFGSCSSRLKRPAAAPGTFWQPAHWMAWNGCSACTVPRTCLSEPSA